MTQSETKIVKAKEEKFRTTLYWHECPKCGDTPDHYENSLIGETIDCPCGVKIKVIK